MSFGTGIEHVVLKPLTLHNALLLFAYRRRDGCDVGTTKVSGGSLFMVRSKINVFINALLQPAKPLRARRLFEVEYFVGEFIKVFLC